MGPDDREELQRVPYVIRRACWRTGNDGDPILGLNPSSHREAGPAGRRLERPREPRGREPGPRTGEARPPRSEEDPVQTNNPRGAELPVLMTVDEAAALLRTTRAAVYVMVARAQVPGITRIGRRVLFRSRDLLDWLDQKRAPSQKG